MQCKEYAYKYLTGRTGSGKVLRYPAFKFTSNPEYDGYKRDIASIIFKVFDKKSISNPDTTSGKVIKKENWMETAISSWITQTNH